MQRIIHIFSSYPHRCAGDVRRHQEAKASWYRAYKHSADAEWVHCAVAEGSLKRSAATVLGDPKPLPFIKNILEAGMEQARAQPSDIVFLCNEDVAIAEDIEIDLIATRMGWASRRDFMALPRRVTKESIAKGSAHPGADAFFFVAGDWPQLRDKFPDMILARSRWDLVYRSVLQRNGGKEIVNVLAHVAHPQKWIAAEEEPAGLWNIKLFEEYEKNVTKLWDF